MRRPATSRFVLVAACITGLLLCAAYYFLVIYSPHATVLQACQINLRKIARAASVYQTRYGFFPASLGALEKEGLAVRGSFYCPAAKIKPDGDGRYIYVGNLGANPADSWFVAFDQAGNHTDGSRSVVFASGETLRMGEQEFLEAFARFRRSFTEATGEDPALTIAEEATEE